MALLCGSMLIPARRTRASTQRSLGVCRLPSYGTDRASGAGRGTVLRQHAIPVDITLGSVRFHVKDPWIYDLSHVGTTLREDGLLGADFFKTHVVEIDPIAETFSVFAPPSFQYSGRGAAVHLTDRNDHLFIPMTLSLSNGISAQRNVRIDTGSDDAVSDDLVRQSPARRKSAQGVGLGNSYIDYSGVFSTISDRSIRDSRRLGSVKRRTDGRDGDLAALRSYL